MKVTLSRINQLRSNLETLESDREKIAKLPKLAPESEGDYLTEDIKKLSALLGMTILAYSAQNDFDEVFERVLRNQ